MVEEKTLYKVRYYEDNDRALPTTREKLVLADSEEEAIRHAKQNTEDFDELQTGHMWKDPVTEVAYENADPEYFEEGDRVVITESPGENYVGKITSINSQELYRIDNGNNDGTYYWKEAHEITKDINGFRS